MIRRVLCLITAALTLPAASLPAQEDLASQTVVLPVPEDARVEVKEDVIYKRADGRELGMDVYLPANRKPDVQLPAVFFVHGGPTEDLPVAAKNTGAFTSYGQLVASSGLAAVTFTHRFTSGEMAPAAAEDVEDAFAYVREHADELSVDPDRICVWAFSAGGMFVTPFLREASKPVRCVVLYYAAMAAAELGMDGIPKQFQAEYDATDALTAREEPLPRIVVGRAGQDYASINRSLDRFLSAVLEANAPLDLMNHPQGQHAFDLLDDNERSREIIRRTLDIVQTELMVGDEGPGRATNETEETTPPGQQGWSPRQKEVWEQEETYWRLLSAGDIERFMALLDEQVVHWPKRDNQPITRSDTRSYLEERPYEGGFSYELEPLAVNVDGNVGITFYRYVHQNEEGDATGAGRVTHTWRKQDGEWNIIAGMSAAAPDTAAWKRKP